ncbi:hypothetical protein CLF_112607 [Clonorchis sinensis]|uniref:Integrase zinc-binding domain-containing protein n=1 Tax=Clonorchis sinensis TaxID=79923 RepID=G7YMM1_CLOSI|nr:hypothetical protein CLF_112607 [Clonorchis sinensis]
MNKMKRSSMEPRCKKMTVDDEYGRGLHLQGPFIVYEDYKLVDVIFEASGAVHFLSYEHGKRGIHPVPRISHVIQPVAVHQPPVPTKTYKWEYIRHGQKVKQKKTMSCGLLARPEGQVKNLDQSYPQQDLLAIRRITFGCVPASGSTVCRRSKQTCLFTKTRRTEEHDSLHRNNKGTYKTELDGRLIRKVAQIKQFLKSRYRRSCRFTTKHESDVGPDGVSRQQLMSDQSVEAVEPVLRVQLQLARTAGQLSVHELLHLARELAKTPLATLQPQEDREESTTGDPKNKVDQLAEQLAAIKTESRRRYRTSRCYSFLRQKLIVEHHEMAHVGYTKTHVLLRYRANWRRMRSEVMCYLVSRKRCQPMKGAINLFECMSLRSGFDHALTVDPYRLCLLLEYLTVCRKPLSTAHLRSNPFGVSPVWLLTLVLAAQEIETAVTVLNVDKRAFLDANHQVNVGQFKTGRRI